MKGVSGVRAVILSLLTSLEQKALFIGETGKMRHVF